MSRNKYLKQAGVLIAAILMAVAPGLDMAVKRKLQPDAVDFGGYLFQAIGRTIAAIQTDKLTMVFMLFAALWFSKRYLYHKPKRTGYGEYLLCGFFSVMMLCSASIRATGSVQTLYKNTFQLLKVPLYFGGMFVIFLCALRGLNELLHRTSKLKRMAFWDRHPFGFPFAALCIAWLPHIIIKYPGVLMIDSCLQFREYLNLTPRSTTHPPFGTLIYGLMVTFGKEIGSYNIAYFMMMMVQTLSMIAVLSYTLWLMHKFKVPFWVSAMALALFGLSPSYVGWAVVIVKDSAYLILCMLAGALLLDFVGGAQEFMRCKVRLAMLAICLYLIILTRHNGLSVAIPVLLAILITMIVKRFGIKQIRNFIFYGCIVVGLAMGTNAAIIQRLEIADAKLYDWLSIPFQQTARVAKLHGQDITEEEKAAIDKMLDYEQVAEKYTANNADPVKWAYSVEERKSEDVNQYLAVWWQQLKRYPLDYLDALLNMNYVMFDLQSNLPVFIGLSDNSLYDYVYPYSFNDMSFYESEEIRPLNSYQLALTEWYFRFSDLPVIGQFASMGFCVDVMLAMFYLAWVDQRKKALLVWIPSLVAAISGLLCPIVYTRYLLPTICALPLWFAAYFTSKNHSIDHRPYHLNL